NTVKARAWLSWKQHGHAAPIDRVVHLRAKQKFPERRPVSTPGGVCQPQEPPSRSTSWNTAAIAEKLGIPATDLGIETI
ncbi:hypothetical protein ABTA44_21015, partial [Acinetobacter baumannii]